MKATKKQQREIQELLSTVTNSLRAFSLKLTGNMNDAEDLYQDTALRIMTNAEKYNPGTNFKAWAVTIMRNIFINNYRKRVRRNLIIDQTPNNYYINSGNKTVLNDGENDVTFNELQALVDRLPDDFRIPFLMAFQGYKYDEIAEQLGSPLGTIKSRILLRSQEIAENVRGSHAGAQCCVITDEYYSPFGAGYHTYTEGFRTPWIEPSRGFLL